MVNFKLDEKCDRGEIINMTRAWDKEKKIWVRTGIEPLASRTPGGGGGEGGAPSTEETELWEHMESEAILLSSCMTRSRILLGIAISKVVLVDDKWNKWWYVVYWILIDWQAMAMSSYTTNMLGVLVFFAKIVALFEAFLRVFLIKQLFQTRLLEMRQL